MSIKPICDFCNQELSQFGAILFSPPVGYDVKKYHVCVSCFHRIMERRSPESLVGQRADNTGMDAIALCQRWKEFMPKSDSDCPMLLAALLRLMEGVAQRHPC